MTGKPQKTRAHGRVRWVVDFRDAHGERCRRFFPTRAEADAFQATVNDRRTPALAPAVLDARATLRAYGEQWLAANAHLWKPRTFAGHKAMLALHVYRFPVGRRTLGDVRLTELDRAHVKALITAKRRAG